MEKSDGRKIEHPEPIPTGDTAGEGGGEEYNSENINSRSDSSGPRDCEYVDFPGMTEIIPAAIEEAFAFSLPVSEKPNLQKLMRISSGVSYAEKIKTSHTKYIAILSGLALFAPAAIGTIFNIFNNRKRKIETGRRDNENIQEENRTSSHSNRSRPNPENSKGYQVPVNSTGAGLN